MVPPRTDTVCVWSERAFAVCQLDAGGSGVRTSSPCVSQHMSLAGGSGAGELRSEGIVQAPELWVDASTVFWRDGGSESCSSLGGSAQLLWAGWGPLCWTDCCPPQALTCCLSVSLTAGLSRSHPAAWSTAVVSAPRARVVCSSHGQSPLQLTLSCLSPTPSAWPLSCCGLHLGAVHVSDPREKEPLCLLRLSHF